MCIWMNFSSKSYLTILIFFKYHVSLQQFMTTVNWNQFLLTCLPFLTLSIAVNRIWNWFLCVHLVKMAYATYNLTRGSGMVGYINCFFFKSIANSIFTIWSIDSLLIGVFCLMFYLFYISNIASCDSVSWYVSYFIK